MSDLVPERIQVMAGGGVDMSGLHGTRTYPGHGRVDMSGLVPELIHVMGGMDMSGLVPERIQVMAGGGWI